MEEEEVVDRRGSEGCRSGGNEGRWVEEGEAGGVGASLEQRLSNEETNGQHH